MTIRKRRFQKEREGERRREKERERERERERGRERGRNSKIRTEFARLCKNGKKWLKE